MVYSPNKMISEADVPSDMSSDHDEVYMNNHYDDFIHAYNQNFEKK